MKLLYILLLIPFIVYPAFAIEYDLNYYHDDDDLDENSEYSQIVSTSDGTLDVGIYTIPKTPNTEGATKLMISFLKPDTEKIQQHIDYRVSVTKDGDYVYGGSIQRLLHTSPGTVPGIPIEFSENGSYIIHVDVAGIYFQPLPLEHKICITGLTAYDKPIEAGCETASFTINVGQVETSIPGWIKNNAGWWADGQIDEGSFVSGIQWLITNGVMTIPPTEQGTGSGDVIPSWIKNNAGWWADGQIDDSSFVSGLQWLISNGIMKIS